MASPSTAEVNSMIAAAIRDAVTDIDTRFGAILQSQVSRQQAETALVTIIDDAKSEFESSRQRTSDLIEGFNAQFEQHKKVIEGIVSDFQGSSAALASSTQEARVETKTLTEELVAMEAQHTKLRSDLSTEFGQQTARVQAARDDMSAWAEQHKVTVMTMLQQAGSGGSMDQGKGQGQGQGQAQGGKGPSIDKKEVSVWKLPDQVTKQEFRHWLDAVDTYLSAAQTFEYPEVVLDRVRRHPDEVNQSNWAAVMTSANAEVPSNKKID